MADERATGSAEDFTRGREAQARGDLPTALVHLQKALAARRRLMVATPAAVEPVLEAALCEAHLGQIVALQGRLDLTFRRFQKSLKLSRTFLGKGGDPRMASQVEVCNHQDIGHVLAEQGDLSKAVTHHGDALTRWRELPDEERVFDVPRLGCMLRSLIEVGFLLEAQHDLSGALESFQEAAEIQERWMDEYPSKFVKDMQVVILSKTGRLLALCGDPEAALLRHTRCVDVQRDIVASEPHNKVYERHLAITLQAAGDCLLYSLNKADLALPYHKESLVRRLKLVVPDPGERIDQDYLACGHGWLGTTLHRLGDHSGAVVQHQESQRILLALLATEPAVPWRTDLAASHTYLGDAMAAINNRAGAGKSYEQALAILETLAAENPLHPVIEAGLASVRRTMRSL